MYVCSPCVCLVTMEVKRGYQITWTWNYRRLSAMTLVLGIKQTSLHTSDLVSTRWGQVRGHIPIIPALGRLRQEDCVKSEASLD